MSEENLFHKFCPCGCFDGFDHQQESLIKEFIYWFLILNHQQGFLGRALLILKAHKVDEAELIRGEVEEKHIAYCFWRQAVRAAFHFDKVNQAQLGNEEDVHHGHLHWHLVPRYRERIYFQGVDFPYDTPQTRRLNYSRIADRTIHPIEMRIKIRDELLKHA